MARRNPNRRLAPRATGIPGWVWAIGGMLAGALSLLAFLVFVGVGAWRALPGAAQATIRGDYVVQETAQWDGKTRTWKVNGIWDGHTVQITTDTFEGLGAAARYQILGDGRLQVGPELWRYSHEGGHLVLKNPDWRYRLKRR